MDVTIIITKADRRQQTRDKKRYGMQKSANPFFQINNSIQKRNADKAKSKQWNERRQVKVVGFDGI